MARGERARGAGKAPPIKTGNDNDATARRNRAERHCTKGADPRRPTARKRQTRVGMDCANESLILRQRL